jgi:predicted nucleic acid-binding protein
MPFDPDDEHRRIPGKDDVELYIRTYATLLRSSGETRLQVLEQSHVGMDSSLHPKAGSPEPDTGALIYALRRLPVSITAVRRVLLGQSAEVFARTLRVDVEQWTMQSSPGRRRRYYYDGKETLAVYIASFSDVHDLIPQLVALQIEWNKLHTALAAEDLSQLESIDAQLALAARLHISEADWMRLLEIWGDSLVDHLERIKAEEKNFMVRMLGGTEVGYVKATRRWWQPIEAVLDKEAIGERPVYFVSSNTHSFVNLLSGAARRHQQEIIEFIEETNNLELLPELRKLRQGQTRGNWDNFLYYAARVFYSQNPDAQRLREARSAEEAARGIHYVPSQAGLDLAAQVIVLDRLEASSLDPRLGSPDAASLRQSPAVVININYPLGLAAYNVLRQVAESVDTLRGVYVLGKAATLNGSIGDVMIANVIYDEHSENTYWLDNCFSFSDVAPFLVYGSALDNQRGVTVKGTFLQNRGYLDFYHRESFTVVEMEAGPYLNAAYEMVQSSRYPVRENINFMKLPFDYGVLHYASDTPYTQARTLGARGLSYYGMDSSYASSVAILRRILAQEHVLQQGTPPAWTDATATQGA